MNITYLGRKTTIKDSFKEYAAKRLKRLEKFFDDDPNVMIVVTNEGDEETVEVTIKSRGMFFRGEKTSRDRQISLDLVADVLSSQIVRNKNRLERRLKTPVPVIEELTGELEQEGPDTLVKTKKFPVAVMDVEEAILQMNLLGHEFFMFRNGETGEINVVYRRKDGNYGLLEPVQG
ncbi:MAG: ribosome-associated translation inhibitor RaiA [Angelakisella sp.]|nr:ribosome-associated translation inhibitor RaiA [Angelakisella sp.]MCI9665973.1 ribosome-associated translation inhibitor RaiA [Angelakisella sp.]